MPHSLRSTSCASVVFLASGAGGAYASQPAIPEYQAKARYLRALAEFIVWPGSNGPTRPFIVAVLGRSPFELHLNEEFGQRQLQGRQIRIEYYRTISGIKDCDILFICESESDRLPEILSVLKDKPVLTIGDTRDFARRGVMVNMLLQQQRVNMDVNLTSIKQAGLEISSHVLKFAKNVY